MSWMITHDKSLANGVYMSLHLSLAVDNLYDFDTDWPVGQKTI